MERQGTVKVLDDNTLLIHFSSLSGRSQQDLVRQKLREEFLKALNQKINDLIDEPLPALLFDFNFEDQDEIMRQKFTSLQLSCSNEKLSRLLLDEVSMDVFGPTLAATVVFRSDELEQEHLAQAITAELLKSNIEQLRAVYKVNRQTFTGRIDLTPPLFPNQDLHPVCKAKQLLEDLKSPQQPIQSTSICPSVDDEERSLGVDEQKDLCKMQNMTSKMSCLVNHIGDGEKPRDVVKRTLLLCSHWRNEAVIYVWINLCTLRFYVGKAQRTPYLQRTLDHFKESCGMANKICTPRIARYLRYYGCGNFLVLPLRRLTIMEEQNTIFVDSLESYYTERLKALKPHGYNSSTPKPGTYIQ
jgi:hypothetical protein